MNHLRAFIKIDPIFSELLRAGMTTYKTHFKVYLLVNVSFIALFLLILGIPSSLESNMRILDKIFAFFNSYQYFTQTIFFYGVIGLVITIITYYLTFNQTLNSGELGLEIKTKKTSVQQFLKILLFNLTVLTYFLIWVVFYRIIFDLLTFSTIINYPQQLQFDYSLIFFSLLFIVFSIVVFFLFVVKLAYYIYLLDEFKVPNEAMDPLIFSFGCFFGLLILILDMITIVFPSFWKIAVIITYLTPGTILMPILGYSMAHLKVASTVLGFEYLIRYEDTMVSKN